MSLIYAQTAVQSAVNRLCPIAARNPGEPPSEHSHMCTLILSGWIVRLSTASNKPLPGHPTNVKTPALLSTGATRDYNFYI
ncbi:hypothetical protein GCM10010912_00570 [Paenibacillus albidus]|uniref:Uncharacterized protein n=1 Tax=Paenibacillus albidus TaxID=2041023 RepID=A0A917F995_9BACL|nr:hypothetical protein GCM10010912_00570 [Paenibacillus albidus]